MSAAAETLDISSSLWNKLFTISVVYSEYLWLYFSSVLVRICSKLGQIHMDSAQHIYS